MSFNRLEKIITKTGVISLAALAVIGVIACFICTFGIDMGIFSCTVMEDTFIFILGVLSILVGFCFPVSFLFNISKIALALVESNRIKRYKADEDGNLQHNQKLTL